jgi:LuxR family maltose regulon positive regulatory protein
MTVAEVPFDLLGVKLAAPSARPGTVAKADAIGRLCASTLPFATVVAPAGYGKTTLLAKWVEADPRPFAWVALDGRDDDAVVFLRYIAAAIHGVEPVPDAVFAALSGPGGSTWTSRVPRVGSALAALERPLVLVLDDLHAVANPSCLDVLAALVEYVRPARRSRSRAGKTRHCRLPAGGRTAWCTRSACRTSDWTRRRPGCCSKLPESSWTRTRFLR